MIRESSIWTIRKSFLAALGTAIVAGMIWGLRVVGTSSMDFYSMMSANEARDVRQEESINTLKSDVADIKARPQVSPDQVDQLTKLLRADLAARGRR